MVTVECHRPTATIPGAIVAGGARRRLAEVGSTRDRIMDAVVACVDRRGLAGFALEDVAAEAGVSRATIYRHFEGGRDQLVREAVTREVARFWAELAVAVEDIDDLESRLVVGMMLARERLQTHDLLQRLLAMEPEEFLPALFESDPLVHLVVRDYLRDLLAGEQLTPGVELDDAADYLSRMLLSHIGSPGRWDMSDEDQVRRLVRTQYLAGVLEVTDVTK
jgi:AcrR family transcriptional regulator